MPLAPLNVDEFAFLFDVDGTLVDIAPTPDAVQVPQGLRRNLDHLRRLARGAVALVSGRSLASLDRLFGPLKLSAVGGHGAEMRLFVDGTVAQHSAAPLDLSLQQRIAAIGAIDSGIIIENKGYSIAIHYRQARDRERAILDAISEAYAAFPADTFEMLHGKAVVEIKKRGFSKGTAIRALMEHAPFAGRRPIFVGDDITDEDAFSVMPEFDGIAISVGRIVKGVTRRFEDPRDVRRWVEKVCEAGERLNPPAAR